MSAGSEARDETCGQALNRPEDNQPLRHASAAAKWLGEFGSGLRCQRSLIRSANLAHLAHLGDRYPVTLIYNHQVIWKHPVAGFDSLCLKPHTRPRGSCVCGCTSIFQWAGRGGGAARLAGSFVSRSSKPATCPLTHFLKRVSGDPGSTREVAP